MQQANHYPIGREGEKWGEAEKAAWLSKQSIKRAYQTQVVDKITPLAANFDVQQYGSLPYDPTRYPLFVIKNSLWDHSKKTVLITGGVHGYETSGVQGAIRFVESAAAQYQQDFNLIVAPCISPWGYETINRWNPNAVDPNRSFYANSPAAESAAIMAYIEQLNIELLAHIDLHETTDTDNSEFRPALAAREGFVNHNWNIPDGFYLVGDTLHPVPEFQKAIIDGVSQVTHIAPADDEGKLIGVPLSQEGVVNYATKSLGLCIGFSGAQYCTTTEVYPDSPKVDDENCILAQVAAITSALDFLKAL